MDFIWTVLKPTKRPQPMVLNDSPPVQSYALPIIKKENEIKKIKNVVSSLTSHYRVVFFFVFFFLTSRVVFFNSPN